jgi:hypothetical protein
MLNFSLGRRQKAENLNENSLAREEGEKNISQNTENVCEILRRFSRNFRFFNDAPLEFDNFEANVSQNIPVHSAKSP